MSNICFRTFEECDIDAIYRWKNDDELNRLAVGLNKRVSRDDVAKWVRSKMPHNPYEVFWAICTNDEEQRIIGYACLTNIHYINSSAYFSGIMIGDPAFHDGITWIEVNKFVLEYVFERLGLNRMYGSAMMEQEQSNAMGRALFLQTEGVERQAVYKNGRFYDVELHSILKSEYFEHKAKGEYETACILKRLVRLKKDNKK
ncbi:MAG: GNAT family N-acetyltransferase [Bacteroidaceae bacterium]|nr:GNAT family N-acetyltransferase [Bacteroidaceae bacterium]